MIVCSIFNQANLDSKAALSEQWASNF